MEQLIAPVNGFIILDLHNLYCQLHNFEVGWEEILPLYPLERVREIHISGGSWEDSTIRPGKKIRRDTHDAAVPVEVFALLDNAIDRCPNLRYVVLEQLGTGLDSETSRQLFREDFLQLDRIVRQKNDRQGDQEIASTNDFLPSSTFQLGPPLEDASLHAQQLQLSHILETATDYQQAQQLLQASDLAHSAWEVEQWEPAMVETVMKIARKWKDGFVSTSKH